MGLVTREKGPESIVHQLKMRFRTLLKCRKFNKVCFIFGSNTKRTKSILKWINSEWVRVGTIQKIGF